MSLLLANMSSRWYEKLALAAVIMGAVVIAHLALLGHNRAEATISLLGAVAITFGVLTGAKIDPEEEEKLERRRKHNVSKKTPQ